MSTARQARVRAITTASLVGVAALGLVGLSQRGSPAAGTAASTTAAPAAETAPPTTEAAFADGASASQAAESLIAPYIESEYAVSVTDVACSEPATGTEGEEFVCYALAPRDVVVALRATIDTDLVISLAEITGLTPTTTVAPTTAPGEIPTTSAP